MEKQKTGIFKKVIINPILSYRKYWTYYSSTSKNLIPLINRDKMSELKKTFLEVRPPKKTFQESMQREGIIDEDLPQIYFKLKIFLWASIVINLYLVYMVYQYITKDTAIMPILYSLTVIAPFILSNLFYFVCSWMMWKIRNKMDIDPKKYLMIIKKYPYQLSPFIAFKDKMVTRYGKKWNKNKEIK